MRTHAGRALTVLILFVLLAGAADGIQEIDGLMFPSIEQAARLPDGQIDLTAILLQIANSVHRKFYQEDLNIRAYLEEMDRMTAALSRRIQGQSTPRQKVLAMNRYFYEEAGFQWDEAAEQPGRRMDNLLLNTVMDRRRGTCAGLSFAYMALAHRVGLPVHAVIVPEHIFLRFDDGRARINIEAKDQGREPSDRYYMHNKKIRPDEPFYMHSLSKKQAIGMYYLALGAIYRSKDMPDSAIDAYEKGLLFTPGEPHLQFRLAQTLHLQGKVEEAIVLYLRALERDPRNARIYSSLGDALQQSARYRKSLQYHEKAIELDPTHPLVRYNAGAAYFANRMWDQAIVQFRKAIQYDPQFAEAYMNLGNIYLQQERFDEAVVMLEKAVQLKPGLSQADLLLKTARRRLAEASRQGAA